MVSYVWIGQSVFFVSSHATQMNSHCPVVASHFLLLSPSGLFSVYLGACPSHRKAKQNKKTEWKTMMIGRVHSSPRPPTSSKSPTFRSRRANDARLKLGMDQFNYASNDCLIRNWISAVERSCRTFTTTARPPPTNRTTKRKEKVS